jgi:hypothetical protein
MREKETTEEERNRVINRVVFLPLLETLTTKLWL